MFQRARDFVCHPSPAHRFQGGQGFVVLLPGIDSMGGLQLAELIRFAVSELNFIHERSAPGRVPISLGCSSMLPTTDVRPQLLIDQADLAL